MGCDGGTIPKRDELVRTKKKPEQVNAVFFRNGYDLIYMLKQQQQILEQTF